MNVKQMLALEETGYQTYLMGWGGGFYPGNDTIFSPRVAISVLSPVVDNRTKALVFFIGLFQGHAAWCAVDKYRVQTELLRQFPDQVTRQNIAVEIRKFIDEGLLEVPKFKTWYLWWANFFLPTRVCPTKELVSRLKELKRQKDSGEHKPF